MHAQEPKGNRTQMRVGLCSCLSSSSRASRLLGVAGRSLPHQALPSFCNFLLVAPPPTISACTVSSVCHHPDDKQRLPDDLSATLPTAPGNFPLGLLIQVPEKGRKRKKESDSHNSVFQTTAPGRRSLASLSEALLGPGVCTAAFQADVITGVVSQSYRPIKERW